MTSSATKVPEYLTVPELAELLRIKERKVYDLAASGDVPCSRVTGRLLFPAAEVRAWIARNRSDGLGRGEARPAVVLGDDDPLLEWALRESRSGLAAWLDGSRDGLARFNRAEGMATGVCLPDGDGWNLGPVEAECAGQNAALLGVVRRTRGLAVRQTDARRIAGAADLALRRVAVRQVGSGADEVLARLLSDAGLTRDAIAEIGPFRGDLDAALAVADGAADAGVVLETCARRHELAFVPLVHESYDILVDRRAAFGPPLKTFLDFAHGAAFRARAEALGGYDLSDLGQVRWNA